MASFKSDTNYPGNCLHSKMVPARNNQNCYRVSQFLGHYSTSRCAFRSAGCTV